ncbi:MAG: ABC transporter permease [Chitinophagaceae bacterium]
MFRNYLKTAWRNIIRNRTSSIINIVGLGLGMLIALMIGIWVYGELSYDKYFKNYGSIVHIMQNQTVDGVTYTQSAQPYPLADAIREEFGSNFKYIVNASWTQDHILSYKDKNITFTGNYMSPDGDAMLSLQMLSGRYGGLKDPNTILMSQSTAKALFGSTDVLGKMVKLDGKLPVQVVGVYADLPSNSSFNDLKFIAPWDLYVSDQQWVQNAKREQQWDNNSFLVYAQLATNVTIAKVSKNIADIKYRHCDNEQKSFKPKIFPIAMKDWYLRSHFENGIQKGGQIDYVWMFGIVGFFVLLLACINFMNLSTARSEKRAKEVGIRKTLGSERKQLIRLFYTESFLTVLLAATIALLLMIMLLPFFNNMTGKELSVPYRSVYFWLALLVFIGFTTFLAGSYPALFLSSFKPVKVLKGTYRLGKSATLPRKILVVFQLTVSTILIIATIVVYLQIEHVRNRPLGYDQNGLISFNITTPEYYGKYDLLRNELLKNGAVIEMAESSSPLTTIYSNSNSFIWEGKGDNKNLDFGMLFITHDYGKLIQWKMVAGRDFSRDFKADTANIIINEAAAKYMGFKNPIGKTVRRGADAPPMTIIGVVKDVLSVNPTSKPYQCIYMLNYENANCVLMKLNPARSVQSSLQETEKIFKKYIPNAPFDYTFVDKDYAKKFTGTQRIGNLALSFSVFAIILNALGLIGLTGFIAEQKTKEIGIRKVLGASVSNLWLMLSKEFIVLVGIACLVSVPLAYGYMQRWLSQYEYRTSIPWWLLVACALLTVLLTLLAVSYYGIKAARANPVKSLRTE